MSFDFIEGITKSGGIDQFHGDAFEKEFGFDAVASGAGDIGDDGTFMSEEGIEEGAFADVGFTAEHDQGTVAQDMSLIPGIEEVSEVRKGGIDLFPNLGKCGFGQFVFGKVEGGFQLGGHEEEVVVEGVELTA